MEKFAFFSGDAPRNQAVSRWAHKIDPQQARNILAIPGVMETMLDLGYDPLHILDEHAALHSAAA
jgi:hypothetical protein